jgi:hypothetical protein
MISGNYNELAGLIENISGELNVLSTTVDMNYNELTGSIEIVSSDLTEMISGNYSELTGLIESASNNLNTSIETTSSNLNNSIQNNYNELTGMINSTSGNIYYQFEESGLIGDNVSTTLIYNNSIIDLYFKFNRGLDPNTIYSDFNEYFYPNISGILYETGSVEDIIKIDSSINILNIISVKYKNKTISLTELSATTTFSETNVDENTSAYLNETLVGSHFFQDILREGISGILNFNKSNNLMNELNVTDRIKIKLSNDNEYHFVTEDLSGRIWTSVISGNSLDDLINNGVLYNTYKFDGKDSSGTSKNAHLIMTFSNGNMKASANINWHEEGEATTLPLTVNESESSFYPNNLLQYPIYVYDDNFTKESNFIYTDNTPSKGIYFYIKSANSYEIPYILSGFNTNFITYSIHYKFLKTNRIK